MFLTPIALRTPEKPAVPKAPNQSSPVGSSLPLFLALSKATGPAICTASNNPGPSIPPTIAPRGFTVTAPPIAAPPALESNEPPNCPACSTVANGKSLQLYPSPSGFINRAAADS